MRGTLSKVNAKIPGDNSYGTIFPPSREFANAYISKMLPLKAYKLKTYQYTYHIKLFKNFA